MLTEKDYCDYDTSITLGELGFPLKRMKVKNFIDGQFSESIVTVLFYEAQKWLRKEKKIGVFVSGFKNGYTFWINDLLNGDTLYQGFFDNQTGKKYKSYEEALSEGIKESIKILKNRNNS